MSRWPAYAEYRYSRRSDLRRLPAHWTTASLRYVSRLEYGNSLPAAVRKEGRVAVYGSNGAVGSHSKANTLGPVLVVGRKGSYGKVNYSDAPVYAIDTTYYVDSRCTTANLRWLYYVLLTLRLDSFSEDSAVPGLGRELVYRHRVPVLPLPEQLAIANFLDRETARIDVLVARFERLIALLEERRAALISHAVTKGLDPDVPMKDSGIPWLGEIPVGWSKVRVRYVARLESGHTPSRQHPEYWQNCTIPWFSLADVWQIRNDRNLYIRETKELVSELGLANSSARLLPKDTVILSRTASVGFSGIIDKAMATTQDFANWICGARLAPEYLLFTFRAMRQELGRLTMGSTHQTIYMPDISELTMALPPREEQERIVQTIRAHTAMSYALDAKTKLAISHLQEYRTALISAAVTGKIDVRDRVGCTCC